MARTALRANNLPYYMWMPAYMAIDQVDLICVKVTIWSIFYAIADNVNSEKKKAFSCDTFGR